MLRSTGFERLELSAPTAHFVREIRQHSEIHLRQRRELAELFGFETRNKYGIESSNGLALGFAAEQGKGIFAFLTRYFLGHWRRFDLHFFNPDRQPIFSTRHPFRFFFQRLEVNDGNGQRIGALQQRFAIFAKRFDVQDARGNVILEVASPFWKMWTFPFKDSQGRELARIEKKWSGLLTESFTDKDRFRLVIHADVSDDTVPLLLAAALFVDLQYFEKKANA